MKSSQLFHAAQARVAPEYPLGVLEGISVDDRSRPMPRAIVGVIPGHYVASSSRLVLA